MTLCLLRFGTIMLTALTMGLAFAHLLEMPPKLGYDGRLWLGLLQTLYVGFGTVGGFCDVGAVVMILILTVAVRRRARAFRWTLVAMVCLVTAHAAFWLLVAPVNAAMLPLTPDTLPPDWTRFRKQWEYTHATRAVLQIVALGALVGSLLVEVPDDPPARGGSGG